MRLMRFAAVLLGSVVWAASPAAGDVATAAPEAFENGKSLLASAKFDEALQAFETAAKSDGDNPEYRQQYTLLRQVIRLRQLVETETSSDRWLAMAQSLRAYYHEHGVYGEALALDRKIHEQRLLPDSAAPLAETLLAMGRPAEAAEVLAGVSGTDATPRAKVLLGLALARQGRIDEAKASAQEVALGDDAEPRLHYEYACLRAATGDAAGSIAALTRSFEATPPTQLDALKAQARICPDFNALASGAEFAQALETPSKVQESGCSKGPSCGQCPKRASCGKSAETKSCGDH